MTDIAAAWIYIVVVLLVSLTFGTLVSRKYAKESSGWQTFQLVYAFLPALTAVIVQLIIFGSIDWRAWGFRFSGNWLYYLAALLLPIFYFGLNILLQLGTKSYTFKQQLNWTQITLMFIVQEVILFLFILGEEIGWRSFLQNKLLSAYGLWPGIVLLGLVWGIWHAPVALKGYNLPDWPRFEAFVFYPFICICYASLLVYLTLATKNVFIAVLFHATNNNMAGLQTALFAKHDGRKELIMYFLIGGLMLVLAFFLLRGNNFTNFAF